MIEVKSLSRYYGAHRAVHDISFSIDSGRVVGFLGLNGAGKSTTLRVLAGLLLPSTGSVRIGGVDMARAPNSFRKRIGFLPEDPPLYVEMTVTEYLRYVGSLREMSGAELTRRIPEVLARCQLADQVNRVISELSQGFRKRVGIAQAILHKPDLVILDEPISGLDPLQREEMCALIRSLAADSTVLFSSHNLGEIAQTCDSILVLHEGRLVHQGTEAELSRSVSGGRSVHFTLRGDGETVSSFLSAQDTVARFELGAAADGCVDVAVELSGDTREALVVALVQAGLGLRRMEDTKDELAEIFNDLIRGDQAA